MDCFFGDSGKGATVDFLTRELQSDLTVRFSGGSQCAHSVTLEDGRKHIFAQFGSGTLAGAKTLLTKGMLIDPLNLLIEEEVLSKLAPNPFENLYIDENCIIITPFHRALNRLLETSRGAAKHGSCGHGVWEALRDSLDRPATSLYAYDLSNRKNVRDKLFSVCKRLSDVAKNDGLNFEIFESYDIEDLAANYCDFYEKVYVIEPNESKNLINTANNPIFEGNQGILLDDIHGFAPHITANSTTSDKAFKLLKDCRWQGDKLEIIGCMRAYATRHGAGPFPTESPELSNLLKDENNPTNLWQDNFRFGWLDLELLNYSLNCDRGIDYLAVSHLDDLDKLPEWKVCREYENRRYDFTKRLDSVKPVYHSVKSNGILDEIKKLGVPIKILATGPRASDRRLT